jgi:hypothetical protein
MANTSTAAAAAAAAVVARPVAAESTSSAGPPALGAVRLAELRNKGAGETCSRKVCDLLSPRHASAGPLHGACPQAAAEVEVVVVHKQAVDISDTSTRGQQIFLVLGIYNRKQSLDASFRHWKAARPRVPTTTWGALWEALHYSMHLCPPCISKYRE